MDKIADRLSLFDFDRENGCRSAIEILAATFPNTPITTYQLGDELYAIFSYNRADTFTYNASDLLKYIVAEFGKPPKIIRSKLPRADAEIYEQAKLSDILKRFVDEHEEVFIPF